MTNPHDRELAGQLPSLSYQLRWRDGGWVRSAVTLPAPGAVDAALADDPVPEPSTVAAMSPSPGARRLSSPREHLATFLRVLARRLDYAGGAR